MSIINAWLGEDRALVGVDTLTVSLVPDAPQREAEKLLVLPNARTVVACMGRQLLFSALASILTSGLHSSFDDVEKVLCAAVRQALPLLPPLPNSNAGDVHPAAAYFDAFRVLAVGWSPRRGCMAGILVRRDSEAGEIEVRALSPGEDWLSAWDALQMGEAPVPNCVEALVAVSRSQVRWAKESTGVRIGGSLIAAELTEDGISVRRLAGALDTEGYMAGGLA